VSNSLWSGGRYESVAEHIETIARQTVEAADRRRPLDGAALVDLACGTGNATLAAAAHGALVTGVDVTPELIDVGRQKAIDTGHAVQWVTADAADTGLPEHSFDVAVSNMGIIFVDPDRQATELGRLLKRTGVLAFSSWRRDVRNPFFDPIVAVLGAPPSRGFSPDQWGDPAIVERRLAADFAEVDITEGTLTWTFASVDAALRFLVEESPMHVDVFGRLDDDQHSRLTSAFRDAFADHADSDGVHVDASYVVVTANRR
jgi:SAM-dependent methyltransferase